MISEIYVKVYADAACTQLVTIVTSPSVDLVQDFALIGLSPATTYWAVGAARDEHDIESESAPWEFTTLAYTIDITGEITYGDRWDRLVWDIEAEAPQGITITGMGVELSLNQDFSTIDASAEYVPGASSQVVSPVLEHTLYYVRYWVRTNDVVQYWQDNEDPTILTRWAPPVFNITADHITTNSMVVTVTYTGGYPIDHNSLSCIVAPQSWSGPTLDIPLEYLDAGHPESFTLTGLPSNGTLYVEVNMDYYEDEVTGQGTFTTEQATNHYVFNGTVTNYRTQSNIYPTQMSSSLTVTMQDQTERVTWIACGIEYCGDEDFSTHIISYTREHTNTWTNGRTSGFNEHKLYYYRFWAETEEYGLEYSSVGSIWSLWNKPELTIKVQAMTDTTATVNYIYDGKMPIPGQGARTDNPLRIDVEDGEGNIVKTVVVAGSAIAGEEMTVTIDGLTEGSYYVFWLRCGYYDLTLEEYDEGNTSWNIEINNFNYGWVGRGELSATAGYTSHTDPVSAKIICEAGPSSSWTVEVDDTDRNLIVSQEIHDRMFHHDGTYTVTFQLESPYGGTYTSQPFHLAIPDNTGVRVTDTELDYVNTLSASVDFSIEVPSIVVCGVYSAGVCRYDGEALDYTETMEGSGDWDTGREFHNEYEIGGTGLYSRPSNQYGTIIGGLRYACGYMEDCFFKRFEGTHFPFVISYVHCSSNTCNRANISGTNFQWNGSWPEASLQIDTDYTFPNPTSHAWSYDGSYNRGSHTFTGLTPSGRYYYRMYNTSEDFPRVFCYPRSVTLLDGGLTLDDGELLAEGYTTLIGSAWYSVNNSYCQISKSMVNIHLTGTDGTDVWIPQSEITMTEGMGGEISFSHDMQLTNGATYRADFTIGTVTCFAQVTIGAIVTTFSNGTVTFSTASAEMTASWDFTSTDPLVVGDLTCTYTDNNGTHSVPSADISIISLDGGHSGTVSFKETGAWTGGTQYTATVSADGVTAGATGTTPSNLIVVNVDDPIIPVNIITVSVNRPTEIIP